MDVACSLTGKVQTRHSETLKAFEPYALSNWIPQRTNLVLVVENHKFYLSQLVLKENSKCYIINITISIVIVHNDFLESNKYWCCLASGFCSVICLQWYLIWLLFVFF